MKYYFGLTKSTNREFSNFLPWSIWILHTFWSFCLWICRHSPRNALKVSNFYELYPSISRVIINNHKYILPTTKTFKPALVPSNQDVVIPKPEMKLHVHLSWDVLVCLPARHSAKNIPVVCFNRGTSWIVFSFSALHILDRLRWPSRLCLNIVSTNLDRLHFRSWKFLSQC